MLDAPLERSWFGSKFGRRLLILFIVCSLLPMTALAVLSFGNVTRQLREGSFERLGRTGHALAAVITERMRFLNLDLGQVSRSAPCTTAQMDQEGPACDGSLLYGLIALAFVPDKGSLVQFFGQTDYVPVLTPGERAAVAAGRGVLLGRMDGHRPAIYLVRRLENGSRRGGMLVAEVFAEYLWGTPDQNPLIPTMQLHVIDDAKRVLYHSMPGDVSLPASVAADMGASTSGTFEWQLNELPYLAAYSPISEATGTANPRWMLVLSEDRAAVEAPMAEFSRTFPFFVLVSLGVAVLLSLSQLRRNLAPLMALQEGTRRLANQQFDQPVAISSRDEFADLAISFNTMAEKISRQFTALVTAAETDQALLSSVDTHRIVETVLTRMRAVCLCDSVSMILLDPASSETATVYTNGDGGPLEPRTLVTKLAGADFERLRREPDGFEVRIGATPAYLDSLARPGVNAFTILPLVYQDTLLGAIALGGGQSVGRGEDEQLQAKRVAGQVALALANARMVDQIRSLAFYDSLTGLPNRVSFKRRLGEELERSRAESRMLAVCFLDLDHFSRINDTLGHRFGDRLVQEVGSRLKACCLRASPAAEVARLGGDEFTVILPDLTETEESSQLARDILESFNTPFALDGHEVFVSASLGIATFPFDAIDMENLLKNADIAMYQAKRKGRNNFQLYASPMGTSASNRLTLEGQLRKAIDAEQFVLWYQPIIDLKSGRVASAEALVRWENPASGIVLPGEFISLCEESGLIVPLGEWILRTVCAQNQAWQRQGLTPIPVAVNLSGQQLRGGGTVELVQKAITDAGLDPRYLVLELTESVLMEDVGDAITAMPALAALGVSLAIDDFGTGYSSLSYLKNFPVNSLKIDKSFIREVTTNSNDGAITSAIIAMGHALGLKVVAEGVETDAQVDALRRMHCDLIQGHWVSRPMPTDAFAVYLQKEGLTTGDARLPLKRVGRPVPLGSMRRGPDA